MQRLWRKTMICILLPCGLLAGMPVQPVTAYEPVPDNWFIETVTLDDAGLPSDFHIYTSETSPEQLSEGVWLTTNNLNTSRRAMITLINRSKAPVYVLSLEYCDRLVMATPDENYAARLKMAHEVASYLVRPGSGEMVALVWEALMDLDHALLDVNQATFNAPPADITPPEAQHSELLMVYGEQVVLIPFTITYTVNQNFKADEYVSPSGAPEPTAAPENKSGLKAGQKTALIASGVGWAALIAWLVWRWRKRH